MITIKSYTDLEQSKKLAEILPIESADMVLPFKRSKNDENTPEYVISRNYIEVYNGIMKLPGIEKEDVCKLIHPCWSLSALLGVLPNENMLVKTTDGEHYCLSKNVMTKRYNNPVDACYEMIIHLNELKML